MITKHQKLELSFVNSTNERSLHTNSYLPTLNGQQATAINGGAYISWVGKYYSKC